MWKLTRKHPKTVENRVECIEKPKLSQRWQKRNPQKTKPKNSKMFEEDRTNQNTIMTLYDTDSIAVFLFQDSWRTQPTTSVALSRVRTHCTPVLYAEAQTFI